MRRQIKILLKNLLNFLVDHLLCIIPFISMGIMAYGMYFICCGANYSQNVDGYGITIVGYAITMLWVIAMKIAYAKGWIKEKVVK